MADIDKFKLINDRYGHQTGDVVLKTIGKILSSAARPMDLAARYGGEEMALVMPGTTRQIAATIAEDHPAGNPQKRSPARECRSWLRQFRHCELEPGLLREPVHLLKAADMGVSRG